jgi:2-oxopent-4-enoate hydratase
MLSENTFQKLASELLEAEAKRSPVEAITGRFPEIKVNDAYKIQTLVTEKKLERGELIVGKKIGLTSKAMQSLLGVYEPDYGQITDKMMLLEGENIDMSTLIQPKIEPELAFILKEDLKGPGVTVANVLKATEVVMPALEIIDSRIKDWKIKIQDTVADNASSARVILGGRPAQIHEIDLKHIGLVFEKNDVVVGTAAGAAVLGNPANAVTWLINKLSEFGVSAKAGEIVMSGSLVGALPAASNDNFRATFDKLGSVNAKFSV